MTARGGYRRRAERGLALAQSDTAYPSPAELLGTTERDAASFPRSAGATDPTWWTSVWNTPAGPAAELGATHLASTDLAWSRRLFEACSGPKPVNTTPA